MLLNQPPWNPVDTIERRCGYPDGRTYSGTAGARTYGGSDCQTVEGGNRARRLGDFVLGAVDGTVTTFANVAGCGRRGLTASAALVLGLANVIADGFSMAVGNYLKARSDNQLVDRYRRIEEKHVRTVPRGEREEIRQIFAAKGFENELLEHIVNVITSDRKRWVDTMLAEEWGLQTRPRSPWRAGLVTFGAFVVAGAVPLAPLVLSGSLGPNGVFAASATALTFLAIGAVQGKVTHRGMVLSALETVLVGGTAAGLAFLVPSAVEWPRATGAAARSSAPVGRSPTDLLACVHQPPVSRSHGLTSFQHFEKRDEFSGFVGRSRCGA